MYIPKQLRGASLPQTRGRQAVSKHQDVRIHGQQIAEHGWQHHGLEKVRQLLEAVLRY